ncbi:hypothetical protein SAMN05216352_1392 [Alteribacillus bidgolensis]|uniref:Uncharacterized protein n=1 Tax=Alteribacillus bidgolensis TaxID=930129 RepID=A0A1G8S1F2_9BACI|nr:hypothetical protein SAMN05216352_1392 [Alteribacillus bidgolensis]
METIDIHWTTNPIAYFTLDFFSKLLVTLLFISLSLFMTILFKNSFSLFITLIVLVLSPFTGILLDESVLKFSFFYMSDPIVAISTNVQSYYLYSLKNLIYILMFLLVSIAVMSKSKIGV